jgi:rhomboid-like protein
MMKRLFLHTPGSGRALPMLLSTFSHVGIVHLGFNMAGLWSFGGAVSQQIGYSQMLAVYLSSGVATSFFSACFSVLSRRPVFPSLGASGGILALASTFGFLYPDAQFYLLFYPLATFPAQKVLAGTVLFDLVGLVGGWTMFDHAAHLGGIGLGAAFIHFKGYKCVAMYQSQIYRWYDDFYQKVIDDEKDKKTCFLLRPKDEKTHFQWKPKS